MHKLQKIHQLHSSELCHAFHFFTCAQHDFEQEQAINTCWLAQANYLLPDDQCKTSHPPPCTFTYHLVVNHGELESFTSPII